MLFPAKQLLSYEKGKLGQFEIDAKQKKELLAMFGTSSIYPNLKQWSLEFFGVR